jgi:hypothetical protein
VRGRRERSVARKQGLLQHEALWFFPLRLPPGRVYGLMMAAARKVLELYRRLRPGRDKSEPPTSPFALDDRERGGVADELVVNTSNPDWFTQLARAYKLRSHVVLVDDAKVGINPESETLLAMGLRAKLNPREWAAVLVALGLLGMGAWLIVMAVLDPEPYSKIIGAITAGAILFGTGGFAAIRILTKHKPPKVTVSTKGLAIAFEIAWE